MIQAETFVRAVQRHGFELWTGVPCSYLKPFINYVIDAGSLQDARTEVTSGEVSSKVEGSSKKGSQSVLSTRTMPPAQASAADKGTSSGSSNEAAPSVSATGSAGFHFASEDSPSLREQSRLRYIAAVNEGDAVAIAAGSTLAGKPAVVMFQNSGLGNAVNPLSSLTYIFKIPVLIITTLRGEPGGPHDEPQHELMGAITTDMLEILKIRWEYFPTEEGEVVPAVNRAVQYMQETRLPFAFVMRKDSVAPYALRSKAPAATNTTPAYNEPNNDPYRGSLPLEPERGASPASRPASSRDASEAEPSALEVGQVTSPASNSNASETSPSPLDSGQGAFSAWPAQGALRRLDPKVKREAILRVVQRQATPETGDLVIATTGYTGRELYALDDRINQFYMVGSMGCASSFALGVALAHPDRRVIVLDGDGAVLMRMGALAVLGTEKPRNLIHIVLDNGAYESTGDQATVSPHVDLCAVAQACGYEQVMELNDPEELELVLKRMERATEAEPAEAGLTEPGAEPSVKSSPKSSLRSSPKDSSTPFVQSQAGGLVVGRQAAALTFIRIPILSGVPDGLPRPKVTPPQVAERFRAFLDRMQNSPAG